jgi:hypothetical protein
VLANELNGDGLSVVLTSLGVSALSVLYRALLRAGYSDDAHSNSWGITTCKSEIRSESCATSSIDRATVRFDMPIRWQPSLSRLLFLVIVLEYPSLVSTASISSTSQQPLWSFVDPLIGTVGPRAGSAIAGGNSFPGASLPWAMAKPGIDTSYIGLPNGSAVDANAGYTPLGNVTAVSMTHVSGSGGAPTCRYTASCEKLPVLTRSRWIDIADATLR